MTSSREQRARLEALQAERTQARHALDEGLTPDPQLQALEDEVRRAKDEVSTAERRVEHLRTALAEAAARNAELSGQRDEGRLLLSGARALAAEREEEREALRNPLSPIVPRDDEELSTPGLYGLIGLMGGLPLLFLGLVLRTAACG